MTEIRARLPTVTAAALAFGAFVVAAPAQEMEDPMMGGGTASRQIQRDPVFYRESVQPAILQHCAGCHDATDPDNRTAHKLFVPQRGQPLTDEQVEKNYKNTVSLLHPTDPARSRMLLKLVPLSMGGVDHDGGKADGDDFPFALIDAKGDLVKWIYGGSKTASPPVAVTAPVPRTVEVGTTIRLDGTLSYDPDGDEVKLRWELLEAPLGAKAKLLSTSETVTSITPDRVGPWRIRLHPSDGKLGGWPRIVRFSATRRKAAATDSGDTVAKPAKYVGSRTRRLCRALFLDLQGRSPVEEEIQAMAAETHERRVDRMLGEVDTWKHWFDEEAFYFLLIDRFRPVSDRLAAVPDKFSQGHISFRDAHTEFALSAEFNARNPGNDTYVTVVLEQFLGVEVQSEPRLLKQAKKMYDGSPARIFKRKGVNQSDVVQITLAQDDYVDLFVTRMEERYIGYALPKAEHELYVERLVAHPRDFPEVLRDWLVSERYTALDRPPKPKSDHQFIRSLFVDLLGRPPAYEEFRNMRNALQAIADPTPLRGVLAKVILDSGAVLEPTVDPKLLADDATGGAVARRRAEVTQVFHRFLGRDPSEPELEVFIGVLAEPGASWRTAALAILTSPHYQYY